MFYELDSFPSSRMTFVTGVAVVRITGFSPMFVIHRGFVVLVTGDARKDRKVCGTRMAVRTSHPAAGTVLVPRADRKERRVIKRRWFPRGGAVAGDACFWIICRGMCRIGSGDIIGGVTLVAVRCCSGVPSPRMAAGARR